MAMNKTIFDENWKKIRSQSTIRWNLMAEYDLVKVDKAEVKFDNLSRCFRSSMDIPVSRPVEDQRTLGRIRSQIAHRQETHAVGRDTS
jgi:hypothetical protein